MRHLRLMIVAALLALTADPVSAAPAKHHKKVVATPSEAALAKDLIYSCAPEIIRLSRADSGRGQSVQWTKGTVLFHAAGKAREFGVYRRRPWDVGQTVEMWRSIVTTHRAEGKETFLDEYLLCLEVRFGQQLRGAPLLTTAS